MIYMGQLGGLQKQDAKRKAQVLLDFLDLFDFRNKEIETYSGGMKQKTELARALALKPKILLLDEPFAQVDALTRLSLHEELIRVSELEKRTSMFVTHSIQEAIFLGDRICVLTKRPGKIKEEVRVEFPKPRKWADLVNERSFARLHSRLVSLVQEGESGNDVK